MTEWGFHDCCSPLELAPLMKSMHWLSNNEKWEEGEKGRKVVRVMEKEKKKMYSKEIRSNNKEVRWYDEKRKKDIEKQTCKIWVTEEREQKTNRKKKKTHIYTLW